MKPRILVIEDNIDLRESVAEWLASEGYDVATAENGAEAIAGATQDRPALILLDLTMPVMDGLTFLAKQPTVAPLAGVPVIITTAIDFPAGPRPSTVQAVVAKPFSMRALLPLVARICATETAVQAAPIEPVEPAAPPAGDAAAGDPTTKP